VCVAHYTCVKKCFQGPEENYTNVYSKPRGFIPEDAGNLCHKVHEFLCPLSHWFYVAAYFSILEQNCTSEQIRIRLSWTNAFMNPFFSSSDIDAKHYPVLVLFVTKIQNISCTTYRILNMRTLRCLETSECERPVTQRHQSSNSHVSHSVHIFLRQTCGFPDDYTDGTLRVYPCTWFQQPTCVFRMHLEC
jgi:hypothetical protein